MLEGINAATERWNNRGSPPAGPIWGLVNICANNPQVCGVNGITLLLQISNWKIVCIKQVWELFCESMKDLHWNVHCFFIKNTFYWRDRLLLTHHSQLTREIYVFFCFYFYFFGEGVTSVVLKLKWNKHQERCSQETQWTQGWNNMWTERVEQR